MAGSACSRDNQWHARACERGCKLVELVREQHGRSAGGLTVGASIGGSGGGDAGKRRRLQILSTPNTQRGHQ